MPQHSKYNNGNNTPGLFILYRIGNYIIIIIFYYMYKKYITYICP